MGHVLEFLVQLVFEVVAYGVGYAVLLVVAPQVRVETQTEGWSKMRWSWRGFSFTQDGKRYLYVESVQLIGIAVIVALIVLVVLANKYLK